MKILFVLLLALLTGQRSYAQSNIADASTGIAAAATSPKLKSDQASEDQKISQLISYIRSMNNAVFIRNGSEYSPGKAADHLQSKWERHKSKIKTAHDFVDKLATQSKTDEAYQIKFSDGKMTTCAEYLKKELTRIESGAAGNSGKSSK